jgi:hypothetical protein
MARQRGLDDRKRERTGRSFACAPRCQRCQLQGPVVLCRQTPGFLKGQSGVASGTSGEAVQSNYSQGWQLDAGVAVSPGWVNAIWQSRAGGPLWEIEGKTLISRGRIGILLFTRAEEPASCL